MAKITETITRTVCDRCGRSMDGEPGTTVLLSLSGDLVCATIECRDLCPRCRTAIDDPIRRLLRQPSPKKAASDD